MTYILSQWVQKQTLKHSLLNSLCNLDFVQIGGKYVSTRELIIKIFNEGDYDIGWIINPPIDLQIAAVTKDIRDIEGIENPCEEVKCLVKLMS